MPNTITFTGPQTAIGASHAFALKATNSLAVEAKFTITGNTREAMQALVSQWSPDGHMSADRFAAIDAGATDGLLSKGYFGAVFDGRYVYFVPEMIENFETHAVVLRYDTHKPFEKPESFEAYDASKSGKQGLSTRGFYGAGFDGRYVYFVPRQHATHDYHTILLRYDTKGEFKNPASWDAHNIGPKQSSQSCAFDGRYLYLVPGYIGDPSKENQNCGNVIRYDTQADLHDPNAYKQFDVTKPFGAKAACFDGGAFDGRYMYLVPLQDGVCVRHDTHGEFDSHSSWQKFDAGAIGMKMNVGAVFDGRYMYYCAYAGPNIFRFDTTKRFEDEGAWQLFVAERIEGIEPFGFDGGYFDGRYVHFMPFVAPKKEQGHYIFHGNFLRFDTLADFTKSSSWHAYDAAHTSGLESYGHNAGAFDGRYFYCAPWRWGPRGHLQVNVHGVVLRHDTLGNKGSFSLRACDLGTNGGLNAAMMGPSFVVNTTTGARIVAAHKALTPGEHTLKGTFDGRTLSLYIDGQLAASRDAIGTLQPCDLPLSIGNLAGASRLQGAISKVSVSV